MRRLDPFLMLDYGAPHHFGSTDTPRGVGVHPHRGFETVTIAWQGAVEHHDSAGGGGVIGPGDVQWMTAGAGILHKEFHERGYAREGGPFHMAQLWVNLPRAHKLTAPGYQPITAAEIVNVTAPDGSVVRVIAGEYQGARGPARTFTPIGMFDARLVAGGVFDLALPASHNAAVLVMSGAITIGGKAAGAGSFVVTENAGERLRFAATEAAHVLVLSGEPIGEPIAAHGPFVMNTAAEIQAAIVDYQRGKFGQLAD
jgi:redox-sensitive bicupin YhaK (pirin superfamily)